MPSTRSVNARERKAPGGDEEQLPGERADFFYNRAKLLYKAGGNCSVILEKVTATLIKAIGLSPLEIKYFLFLAKVFHAALDFASCVYCLRYVLKVSPRHIVARKRLSVVLFQMGQEALCEAISSKNKNKALFSRAKAYFDECMKHDILNKRLWILKSICHIHLNELDQACDAIKRVIRPNKPISAELYILRAKILWAQGLIAQGNQDLNTAKKIDSKHPEVAAFSLRIFIESEKLFHTCLGAIEEQDYGTALKAVKHAMSIAQNDIKLHCLLAKIYRLSGDVQAAFAAIQTATAMFKQATSSDAFDMDLPDSIVLQTNLIYNEMALGYANKGDYQRAIALLNKIIDSERERYSRKSSEHLDIRYLINRADCYRAINRSVDAVRDYSEALSVKPNDSQVKTRLSLTLYTEAVVAFNRSDFITCEKLLSDAIELNPNISEYYLNRGKARYYLQKFTDAYSDFKTAQKLNPENDEINAQLQQFKERQTTMDTGFDDNNEKDISKFLISTSGGSAPALLQQQMLSGTMKTVASIAVTKEDVMESLLNHRASRRLPSLSQSAKDIEEAHRRKYDTSTSSGNGSTLPPPKMSDLMATVNPRLLAPMIASVETREKDKTVRKLLHANRDTAKSKGTLWNMLKYASDSANRQSMRGQQSAKDQKMGGGGGAVSASALKRESEKRLKKNLNSALVAGVSSQEKPVDFLAQLRLNNMMPTTTGGDDASIVSRSSNAESSTHSQSQTNNKSGGGGAAPKFSHASFGLAPGQHDDIYSTRLIIKNHDSKDAVAAGRRRESSFKLRRQSESGDQGDREDNDLSSSNNAATDILPMGATAAARRRKKRDSSTKRRLLSTDLNEEEGEEEEEEDEEDGNTKVSTRSGLVKLLLDNGISDMWPLRPGGGNDFTATTVQLDFLTEQQLKSDANDDAAIERILGSRSPPSQDGVAAAAGAAGASGSLAPIDSLSRLKSFHGAQHVLHELENEDEADY